MALRAVIFGLEGILATALNQSTGLSGKRREELIGGVRQLFDFLRERGLRPIVISNRNWRVTVNDKQYDIDEGLRMRYGDLRAYVANRGDIPHKPKRESIEKLLELEGLRKHEVIMIGMSIEDFRTSVNSGLLFLNAIWDRQEVDYGFVFDSPAEIIRFIDVFALREHHWFYQLDEPVRYRSLGPFSTYKDAYRQYSAAAREAAKTGTPQRHFFLNSLVSSLYFSGLIDGVNYIACVPGHEQGFGNPAMNDVLTLVGNIFRKPYLRDLIYRHTEAPSQREARIGGADPDPLIQLNTIVLRKKPLKNETEQYKSNLQLRGKTVLVFDDFCTKGYSFEAARHYLLNAGASVLLVSWLKTINTNYHAMRLRAPFDPYCVTTFTRESIEAIEQIPYSRGIVDPAAPAELNEFFAKFVDYAKH